MTKIARNAEGSFFVVLLGEIPVNSGARRPHFVLDGPFANRASADNAQRKLLPYGPVSK